MPIPKENLKAEGMSKELVKRKVKTLKELHSRLSAYKGPNISASVVLDEKLKEEVAQICLEIIRDTKPTLEDIQSNSYVLSRFSRYNFNDILDEVFSSSVELNIPERLPASEVLYKWDYMKKHLEEYLKDE